MAVRPHVLAMIGGTPLVELRRLFGDSDIRVLAKLEGQNPGGSVKDRPALGVIEDAMASGEITPDTVIVESSSGNMGVGLAQVCRYLGLRFICVVDPRTTLQNLRMLQAYGAEVEMVREPDPATGDWLTVRIHRVKTLLAKHPTGFWPDQYSCRSNPAAHHRTTIREVLADLDGRLDYLFCATSTCGTACGSAAYLREQGLCTRVVAVDAVGSVIFSDERGRRLIPGLGAGIKPPLLDRDLIDEVVHVTDLECIVGCRRAAREEALLVGGSAGGILSAIERLSSSIPPGSVCVGILPDRGERYLDTIFDDRWVRENYPNAAYLPEPFAIQPDPAYA